MTDETRRPSPKDFDAYADRDGRDPGQTSPLDARPAPGTPGSDATGATEAETPPETLRGPKGEVSEAARPDAAAAEAIERATSAVGQDDGER